MKRALKGVLLPTPKRVRKTKESKLWTLPRELRDIIYDYSISSELSKHYKTTKDDIPPHIDLFTVAQPPALLVDKRLRHEYQNALIRRLKYERWYIPLDFDARPRVLHSDYETKSMRYAAREIRPWLRSLDGMVNSSGFILEARQIDSPSRVRHASSTLATSASGLKYVSSLKVENTVDFVPGTPWPAWEIDSVMRQLSTKLQDIDVWKRGKGPTVYKLLMWARAWQRYRLKEIRQILRWTSPAREVFFARSIEPPSGEEPRKKVPALGRKARSKDGLQRELCGLGVGG